MRARTVVGTVVLLGGAAAGGMALKRRYAVLKATGSLNAQTDLSGAPFGPLMQAPEQPPTADARILPPLWEPAALTALAEWRPAPPRRALGRALAYAWASPVTLAGLLLGLLSGAKPQVRQGVLLFADAGGPAASLLRARGFQATALGHAVIATSDPDDALLAHELVHVRHAERLGVFSALLYGALYPLYGYARHPMERAARTAARLSRGAPA